MSARSNTEGDFDKIVRFNFILTYYNQFIAELNSNVSWPTIMETNYYILM